MLHIYIAHSRHIFIFSCLPVIYNICNIIKWDGTHDQIACIYANKTRTFPPIARFPFLLEPSCTLQLASPFCTDVRFLHGRPWRLRGWFIYPCCENRDSKSNLFSNAKWWLINFAWEGRYCREKEQQGWNWWERINRLVKTCCAGKAPWLISWGVAVIGCTLPYGCVIMYLVYP